MRVLLLGALAVVAATTVGCGAIPTSSSPAPTTAPSTSAPHATTKKKAADGVRGQITAETGSTWTVTTAKGKAFTVTVDGGTAFGTTAAPASAAQFPVGTSVRVTGARHGATVTATRVAPATPGEASPTADPSRPAPTA